ncbi:MAG: hypothetical protein WC317_07685 [Candidatus Omnitrophota bacterium]|jgi:hypothetical protein
MINDDAKYLKINCDDYFCKVNEDFRLENSSLLSPLHKIEELITFNGENLLKMDNVKICLEEIKPIQTDFLRMNNLYSEAINPIASSLLDTSFKMANMFEDIGSKIVFENRYDASGLPPFDLIKNQNAIFCNLSGALSTSIISQDILVRSDFYYEATSYDAQPFLDFKDNVLDLSETYKSIYDTINIGRPYSFNPIAITVPSVELYSTVKLPEFITKVKEELPEEKAIQFEISNKSEKLESLLEEIDEGLLTPYYGMIETLSTKNADRTRHFCSSARELFTHVLHSLSHDKEFFNWDKTGKYVEKGKPTRAGRIQYICKNIKSSTEFADFIGKDIKSKLAFLDVMQKGTHELNSDFDITQLKAIKIILECTLVSMIEIAKVKE